MYITVYKFYINSDPLTWIFIYKSVCFHTLKENIRILKELGVRKGKNLGKERRIIRRKG